MYAFGAFQLPLSSQFFLSSLGKTISSTPSFTQFPLVPCVGLRPHGFPIHCPHPLCMSMGVVLVGLTFGQSCWWAFMGVVPDVARRHSFTPNSYNLPEATSPDFSLPRFILFWLPEGNTFVVLEICYSGSQMPNQVPEMLPFIRETKTKEKRKWARKQHLPIWFFSSDTMYLVHSSQCPKQCF